MIRPEQLADALQRLDPRDRELLALSLHRRVPDEALARMYDYEPAEVSRRRAAAIERLADDLRVQRGEDLGSVLKALLEPNTWSGIEPAPGREFAASQASGYPGIPAAQAAHPDCGNGRRRARAVPGARSAPAGAAPTARAREGAGGAAARRSGGGVGPRARSRGRAGARHARRRAPAIRRGSRTPCSQGGPHPRRAGRCGARGRSGPDGRHAPRRRRLGRPPEPGWGRWHAQLRARQGRPARGAVRVRPADLVVLLDRLRAASRPSCSASRAATRGCG